MQLTVLFLLIGCLSISNAMDDGDNGRLMRRIGKFLKDKTLNAIDSNAHKLTLLNKCLDCIPNTKSLLTWKGVFDEREVAIKIFRGEVEMNQELSVYRALNATYNPIIEDDGIPCVYYAGKIFSRYSVIVMSYYEDTLTSRLLKNRRASRDEYFFSRYSTFRVFLQSVKALKLLQSRDILHNAIDPDNIYLRGNKVLVSNFGWATFDGAQAEKRLSDFSSVRSRQGENRTAMDDLESLVFTIWHVAGVHSMDQIDNRPAGEILSGGTHDGKVTFLVDKCKQFEDHPRARRACQFVCINEIFSVKKVPAYDTIINHLEEAVNSIEKKTGQTRFEWIQSASSSSSSSPTRV